MIARRLLLTTAPIALLAGCANLGKIVDAAPTIASDAQLIADALEAILPTIKTLVGISQKTYDKIAAVVASIKSTASALASSSTASSAASLVSSLVSGVASVVAALGGVAMPSWITVALDAAGALLPILEAAVGIAKAPTAALAPAMPPAEARRILAAVAA